MSAVLWLIAGFNLGFTVAPHLVTGNVTALDLLGAFMPLTVGAFIK